MILLVEYTRLGEAILMTYGHAPSMMSETVKLNVTGAVVAEYCKLQTPREKSKFLKNLVMLQKASEYAAQMVDQEDE